MVNHRALLTLLESDDEPSRGLYKFAVNELIENPKWITGLVQDETKEVALMHLASRSHRVAHLFQCLHPFLLIEPDPRMERLMFSQIEYLPSTRDRIITETATFLLEMLPSLLDVLEVPQVIELLVPALENCFLSPPPALHKLASVIAGCGNILEHLTSDESGGKAMIQWANLKIMKIEDSVTLKTWTQRLIDIVDSCAGKHGIYETVSRWRKLINLTKALFKLKAIIEGESQLRSQQYVREATSNLARLTLLEPDNKKMHVSGQQQTQASAISLEHNTQVLLEVFALRTPNSPSELRHVIKTLQGEKTLSILQDVTKTFPCKLCKQDLDLATVRTQFNFKEKINNDVAPVSNLGIDIFGKLIGDWKVLLSVQALKSVQSLSQSGRFAPVKEKILNLALGDLKKQLAGNLEQRKALRVPLAMTKCGQDTFVLWQVDVSEMEVPQRQVIKIWEVGKFSDISKYIDRVAVLQRNYSNEVIARCRKLPSSHDGKYVPTYFDDRDQDLTISSRRPVNLDVRVIDQDTIDMANKFYALTAPLIESVLANDLTAEFPIDLSQDEINVISHFQTASLILGRSGTGKTTCLIFKLVGKYLTRRKLEDERKIRQVLFTRSSFLADKLNTYVRRLIWTLTSKSSKLEILQEADSLFSSLADDSYTGDNALTLSDDSFPLVCTFNRFLELLENTVKAMDRKNFEDSGAGAISKSKQVMTAGRQPKGRLVDFQAFKLDYWPHLPHNITKNLSVDLVFAEIMGVIKGSSSSRELLTPLSRKEYLTRSSRLAPAFRSETEKSCVYDVFIAYEHLKISNEGLDHIDRVVKLLKAVREDSLLQQLLGSKFEEIYIDEVQDQCCLDFEMLLSFVKDSRGFHFAGDTAQAISQDSTFRFADIKALFHDHFAATGAAAHQNELAQTTLFALKTNYRSHQGILALASFIMAMIWKGFPDTVDKLEPEIGRLLGPKPIFFIGCGIEILVSSNVGHVKLSERSADFGAEQVILVRDEKAKKQLQAQIGSVALVLTILQSKGMEFDDVILWNFFSESPNPAGIRSLNALVKDDTTTFDARKNSVGLPSYSKVLQIAFMTDTASKGICSDLKHLYVAVTRARIQLFFVETNETAIASVVKLLTQDLPEALVDITKKDHSNFLASLETLRPGTTNDPARWSLKAQQLMQQKAYKDALLCFRKALDHRGETIANALVYEEEGRIDFAKGDEEGFRRNTEAAIKCFLEVNLVGDACRNLVRMSCFQRAADLWVKDGKYGKAAPLLIQSGLHENAASCYHQDRNYAEAAITLRNANKFDLLVSYVSSNGENIPALLYQKYSRLCKILLKQGKISPECRKDAISILGSHAEQEACFVEYEMYDDLATFYAERQRYQDLFILLIKSHRLEKAIDVCIEQRSSDSAGRIKEDDMLKLIDYLYAGQMMKKSSIITVLALEKNRLKLPPKVASRVQQWNDARRTYYDNPSTEVYAVLKDSDLLPFFSLRSILKDSKIYRTLQLNTLSIELVHEATEIIKDFIIKGSKKAKNVVFLLIGFWMTEDPKEPHIILPWSPLGELANEIPDVGLMSVVNQWMLEQLALAAIALDTKTHELFREKYPRRCGQYVVHEYCNKKRNGEICLFLHERPNKIDCLNIMNDLRRISAFFCGLSILHNRGTMIVEFQEKFLPIRRRWLELLLRQLTYISPFEQDALLISMILFEELSKKCQSIVGSYLEDLLYHKLGKQWTQRNNFCSLLEQMQLARTFGENVHYRFFRAVSWKLKGSDRGIMQQHLRILSQLEGNIEASNALLFRRNLESFLMQLERLDMQELSSMHALTATVEYLASLSLLKASPQGFMVPRSWLELYISRVGHDIISPRPLEETDTMIYYQCLLMLVKSFTTVLARIEKELSSGFKFTYNERPYHPTLLQRRNAEFLAVGLFNLPIYLSGVENARTSANTVFQYRVMNSDGLIHFSPHELGNKLVSSFAMYDGKDGLVIVGNDPRSPLLFSKYPRHKEVTHLSMDDIRSFVARLRSTNDTTQSEISSSMSHDDYTQEEVEAAGRIQYFWRSRIPKVKQRRQHMLSAEARAVQYYIDMGSRCAAPIALRCLLISRAAAARLKLPHLRTSIAEIQAKAMSQVMHVEVSNQLDEKFDIVVRLLKNLEKCSETAVDLISEGKLARNLTAGAILKVKNSLKTVEKSIESVEEGLLKAKMMIEEMFENVA